MEALTSEQIAFQLILHSGNARSKVIQAIREYRNGNKLVADQLVDSANEDFNEAHKIHFDLIQKEANGEKTEISMLLMHAEDHLMSTLSMKELVKELLELFKEKNV